MAAPAYWIEGALPLPPGPLSDAFLRVALTEELCKILPVIWFAWWHHEFDEPMDGILYAAAAALGFATVESVIYAVQHGDRVILPRAFTATLAHLSLSGLVGYHLAVAHCQQRGRAGPLLLALVLATALHGAYDLLLERLGSWTILLTLPAPLLLLWWMANRADRLSPFRPASADRDRAASRPDR